MDRRAAVQFVGRATHQLPDRCELLRLHNLRLQPFQVVNRIAGVVYKVNELPVKTVLPEEYHNPHAKGRSQRQHQSNDSDTGGHTCFDPKWARSARCPH